MKNNFTQAELLSTAHIPTYYRYATFRTYQEDEINREQVWKAKSYCRKIPDYGLTIIGNFGVGKTRLAISIMRYFLDQGVEGLFYRVPKLLRTIKKGFDGSSASPNLIDQCCEVPFLVIDDLGCCRHTPWIDEVLDDIISERCSEGLPVVVTSNLSQKELEEYLSGRVYSRLVKGGSLIPLTGEDKRGKRIHSQPSSEEIALWQTVDQIKNRNQCANQSELYEDFIRIYGSSLANAMEKKPSWDEFKRYYVECQNQDTEVVRRAYKEYCHLSKEDESPAEEVREKSMRYERAHKSFDRALKAGGNEHA